MPNGGCSEDGATLESLGVTLGISKERVRQIENRALEKLKTALIKQSPASFAQPAASQAPVADIPRR